MKSHVKKWGGWYLVMLYMALVVSISSISFPHITAPRHTDKVIHAIEYGILTLLLVYAMRRHLSTGRVWTTVIVISLTFAASDELHQFFVPRRDCSLGDWLADAFGTLLVVMLLRFLYLHRRPLWFD